MPRKCFVVMKDDHYNGINLAFLLNVRATLYRDSSRILNNGTRAHLLMRQMLRPAVR